MRAMLLLVLGAVLVWFLWHSLDSGALQAADNPVSSSAGVLLAPEPEGESAAAPAPFVPSEAAPQAKEPAAPEQRSALSQATEPNVATQQTSPVVNAPAASSKEASPARSAAVSESVAAKSPIAIPVPAAIDSVSAPASELELARALVSDPTGFLRRVDASTSLSGGRRTLALAIGKALVGADSEARSLLEHLASESDVKSGERECVVRLVERGSVHVSSASFVAESPLVRAAYLVAQSRDAEKMAASNKHRDAALAYSEMMLSYVAAPWASDAEVLRRWTQALEQSQRRHRWSRTGEWPSITVEVREGDNLIGIRKRAIEERKSLLVCTGQIAQANELHGTTLKPGQKLRIPLDRARMLVDLDSHWAFYLLEDEVAAAWEVGVGKTGNETQVGSFVVGEKKEDPMWFRPGQAPVPFGDPENPLGTRWIAWMTTDGVATGLGFHGTKEPESIGKDLSQGCIRMRNPDVERLFEILPKGAEIRVQP